MVRVLTDKDVLELVSMREAIGGIEAAMSHKSRGTFVTPPRHYTPTGKGTLAFTIGGDAGEGIVGFRVYGMYRGTRDEDQLVVVYDAVTGNLRGIVQGVRVGAMRTGALGGIAIKHAAREDAKTLALIGSGAQARTQLEAATVVRDLTDIRVYSRSAENRESFAEEMSDLLSISIRPVASSEEAIAGADIVITATGSREPVYDASLIEPGQHVTTIRLSQGQAEVDPAIADFADALFTDSPEQLRDYPGGSFVADRLEDVSDLSDYVASGATVRKSRDDITVYLSTGLAGTEVVVADLALQAAARR